MMVKTMSCLCPFYHNAIATQILNPRSDMTIATNCTHETYTGESGAGVTRTPVLHQTQYQRTHTHTHIINTAQ